MCNNGKRFSWSICMCWLRNDWTSFQKWKLQFHLSPDVSCIGGYSCTTIKVVGQFYFTQTGTQDSSNNKLLAMCLFSKSFGASPIVCRGFFCFLKKWLDGDIVPWYYNYETILMFSSSKDHFWRAKLLNKALSFSIIFTESLFLLEW